MTRIEDYALLGDMHSAALVSRDGSIDWLCVPRFDSGAVFGAILDEQRGGHWKIAPTSIDFEVSRTYRERTMVLETTFTTPSGVARMTDCLVIEDTANPYSPRAIQPEESIVRVVRGISGSVSLSLEFAPRFFYGYVTPGVTQDHGIVTAVGGPDAMDLRASIPLQVSGTRTLADFDLEAGESAAFVASYRPSHITLGSPATVEDAEALVSQTETFWRRWSGRCTYGGSYDDAMFRSLLTLKALSYAPTGGIVAAATTSPPEAIGGVRNWDYRYCWLRDSTFTLEVLLDCGYTVEAEEWRDWLLRALAGDPAEMQIMYGVRGERRLTEYELPWLAGYEESRPVRVGNAAVDQFQLDVYGEVMDTFHSARRAGIATSGPGWELERQIVQFVCDHWSEPDEGIWEVRSGREQFVHSKVMAWVAVDRGIKAVEEYGLSGPAAEWRQTRETIRSDVLTKGISKRHGRFMRSYDHDELDASLLILPLVGFVPATHPVMRSTIEGIERELVADGLVLRYRTGVVDDGLPPGEGTFLLASFWLVDCLVLLGRNEEAQTLFRRLLALRNDVGLLAEQYDTELRRQVGNFPQAFSHVALATSAMSIERAGRAPVVNRGA